MFVVEATGDTLPNGVVAAIVGAVVTNGIDTAMLVPDPTPLLAVTVNVVGFVVPTGGVPVITPDELKLAQLGRFDDVNVTGVG